MFDDQLYDAVVIGGGPAGILAAYTLAKNGLNAVLLEAGEPMLQSLCPKVRVTLGGHLVSGSERFRLQCPRCTCLTGLGGAAFHFDTNLGYSRALRRSKIEEDANGRVVAFSSLERALGSFERAERAVRSVFEVFRDHGLEFARPVGSNDGINSVKDVFDGVDLSTSQVVTVGTALTLVDSLMRAFLAAGGEVKFLSRATAVNRGAQSRFVVDLETRGEVARRIKAHSVVVAVGKLGLPWVLAAVQRLDLKARTSDKVDIGVRLEGSIERMAPLSEQCANPKLAYVNVRGESVRTFCVCAGGRIMQYEFCGAVVLDGQHCLTSRTKRSNLGIVTTTKVPSDQDGTNFALDLARRVAERGKNRPVACTVGELKQARSGTAPLQLISSLDTSLLDFEHAPLSECLPMTLIDDILEMTERLNTAFPGMVQDSAVLAAPVIERVYPRLALSENMESSQPGLYFVGDASSKIIGVTYGAATGMIAAMNISKSGTLRTSSDAVQTNTPDYGIQGSRG